ncbi:MAG TPA: hypothetical protein EYQ24_02425, partial [Bacteroidetes bacterium]|nr:hypothetical protein [Bacteroidota bacterium]HIL59004.1 hypothetical protein [Rhodothermales bacterium]
MADRPSSTGTGSPCDGLTGLARVRCLREHGKIRGAAARIEAPQRTPRRSAPARPEPAREDRQRDDLGVPVRRTPQQETPALAPPEEERTTRPDPFRPQHVRPE